MFCCCMSVAMPNTCSDVFANEEVSWVAIPYPRRNLDPDALASRGSDVFMEEEVSWVAIPYPRHRLDPDGLASRVEAAARLINSAPHAWKQPVPSGLDRCTDVHAPVPSGLDESADVNAPVPSLWYQCCLAALVTVFLCSPLAACCLSVALLRTKRRLDAAVADIAELGRWRRANAMHANRAILGELSGENSSMQLSLIFRPRRRGQISAMVTQLAK
jgi:hypothetical protein